MVVFRSSSCFSVVLKNAAHFVAPKYPKRFVNPAMGLLRIATTHQKNSGTLFCVGMWLMSVCGNFETQNSLRLRFGSAGCADPAPVFLIQLALGIDGRASVRVVEVVNGS